MGTIPAGFRHLNRLLFRGVTTEIPVLDHNLPIDTAGTDDDMVLLFQVLIYPETEYREGTLLFHCPLDHCAE